MTAKQASSITVESRLNNILADIKLAAQKGEKKINLFDDISCQGYSYCSFKYHYTTETLKELRNLGYTIEPYYPYTKGWFWNKEVDKSRKYHIVKW